MELLEREAEDENKIQIQLFCRFKIKKKKVEWNPGTKKKKSGDVFSGFELWEQKWNV